MEKTITLRKEDDELRCPHCDGGGLSVKRIHICHPSDEMLVAFGTDPLCLVEIDGGDDEGYVTLTVDCPHGSPQGDRFYCTSRTAKPASVTSSPAPTGRPTAPMIRTRCPTAS